MYIKSDTFLDIATQCGFDAKAILAHIQANLNASYSGTVTSINNRISNYRRKGLLPLDSGNFVSLGEVLKGSSTLFDSNGAIKQQWVKTDVDKSQFMASCLEAVKSIAENVTTLPTVDAPTTHLTDDLATLYISNDVHFGALMDKHESGQDWDTELAATALKTAHEYLISNSPASKVGIVIDLGDLLEVNDSRNMTPKSGHVLAVDSRFYKILRAAYESFIFAINEALKKHELVYFYNIGGNHDEIPAIAIREVMRIAFKDNPRVIIDDTPSNIKYHQHGKVLLQFAHGHAMKMRQAGETMAADMQHIFSETKFRFSHLGHTHKDAVYDSAICRAESHRNIAPLNHYAYEYGYRTNGNTMKAITYHTEKGEISRNIYNVTQ